MFKNKHYDCVLKYKITIRILKAHSISSV